MTKLFGSEILGGCSILGMRFKPVFSSKVKKMTLFNCCRISWLVLLSNTILVMAGAKKFVLNKNQHFAILLSKLMIILM